MSASGTSTWQLQKLAQEDLVHGLPEIGQVEQLCRACQAGKQ
jgi:hypothetical protein